VIIFQKNIKYLVAKDVSRVIGSGITILRDFDCEYYSIVKKTRVMTIKRGCVTDGATNFPDTDWILEGSFWHDVLHWLIAQGVIPENENDLIDKELAHIIRLEGGKKGGGWLSKKLLKARSKYVELATHLSDEKKGSTIPLYSIQNGKVTRLK
jgi:hypothetical protein